MARKLYKHATDIQTLIFDRVGFTKARAKAWAKRNKFKYGKVDEKEHTFRLRQHDPGDYKPGTMRTITLTEGVKAVSGVPLRRAAESHGKGYDTRGPRVSNPKAKQGWARTGERHWQHSDPRGSIYRTANGYCAVLPTGHLAAVKGNSVFTTLDAAKRAWRAQVRQGNPSHSTPERRAEIVPVLRLARGVVRTRKKGGDVGEEAVLYPRLQRAVAAAEARGVHAGKLAAAVLREAPSRQHSMFRLGNPDAVGQKVLVGSVRGIIEVCRGDQAGVRMENGNFKWVPVAKLVALPPNEGRGLEALLRNPSAIYAPGNLYLVNRGKPRKSKR